MMLKMWGRSLLFFLPLILIFTLYIGFERGFNIYLLNRVSASMAIVLIILSLSVSSVTYFLKKYQFLLAYRMYLGVAGFFFALFHAFSSLFFYIIIESETPAYQFDMRWKIIGDFTIPNQIAFLLGEIALMIFAFMAIISMKRLIVKLGGLLWRELLRCYGYIGVVFVMSHFFIKDVSKWVDRAQWSNGMIPSSLFLFLLGILLLCLRLALFISLKRKRA